MTITFKRRLATGQVAEHTVVIPPAQINAHGLERIVGRLATKIEEQFVNVELSLLVDALEGAPSIPLEAEVAA